MKTLVLRVGEGVNTFFAYANVFEFARLLSGGFLTILTLALPQR